MAADYATGGVIPPGSSLVFNEDYCVLHVPPLATDGQHYLRLTHEVARATGVTLTVNSALDSVFVELIMNTMRKPDDPGPAGVPAKV